MKYKILSLDGGGSWSLIQARVLLDIYGDEIRGHALLKEFDMVIANSGGSLILACLCNNMKLMDTIDVLQTKEKRKLVFSKLKFWEKLQWKNIASLITRALGPRYSAARKKTGLEKILTSFDRNRPVPIVNTPLNQLPGIIGKPSLQILIVGFDYFQRRVRFFRSNTQSPTDQFSNYYSVTLLDAIHSSSNAPVNYFDSPAEIAISRLDRKDKRTTWFWDGAVSGFNNPVLAGLIEAMTNNPQLKPDDYCILSIGTSTGSPVVLTDEKDSSDPAVRDEYLKNTNNPFALTDTSSGFIQDIRKLSTSILGDPPDSATFIAYCYLDPTLSNKANLVRINPCMQVEKDANGVYGPPAVYNNVTGGRQRFLDLLNLDMDAVEDKEVKLVTELCNKFIVTDDSPCLPNQLIRGKYPSVADPHPKFLGQPTYKIAKEKWLSCK